MISLDKALLGKSMVPKGTKLSGGKPVKDCVTLLLICNMDGSEKRRPIIVGKSKIPMALCVYKTNKRALCDNLPCDYYNTKRAWMNRDTFGKILDKWNQELQRQNRHVVLIMDNHVSHQVKPTFDTLLIV